MDVDGTDPDRPTSHPFGFPSRVPEKDRERLEERQPDKTTQRKKQMVSPILCSFRGYTCRGCGTVIAYPERFKKCPVCGIKGGW